MHHRQFENPWYVQRSKENDLLHRLNVNNGLESIVNTVPINGSSENNYGFGSYATRVANNIFSAIPTSVKGYGLAWSLAVLLYFGTACFGGAAPTPIPSDTPTPAPTATLIKIQEPGPKVAIYPVDTGRGLKVYGMGQSILNEPIEEFNRICSSFSIRCSELDYRKEYSLEDLEKFDVILFNTPPYRNKVVMGESEELGKGQVSWIPEDTIKQYVKNGGKFYALFNPSGWGYEENIGWLPTRLVFQDGFQPVKILEPLHPIFSRVLSSERYAQIDLERSYRVGSALDYDDRWTYLLGTPDMSKGILLEIQYGKGIFIINTGYYNSIGTHPRVTPPNPVASLIVDDTLAYLLDIDPSTSTVWSESNHRFRSGRLAVQIEEITNNSKLSNDQKKREIQRIIEAVKRGSQYEGSLQDKTIETLIEYATPDSDETTRTIQRNAVKWMFETDEKKSDQLWGNIEEAIQKSLGD